MKPIPLSHLQETELLTHQRREVHGEVGVTKDAFNQLVTERCAHIHVLICIHDRLMIQLFRDQCFKGRLLRWGAPVSNQITNIGAKTYEGITIKIGMAPLLMLPTMLKIRKSV